MSTITQIITSTATPPNINTMTPAAFDAAAAVKVAEWTQMGIDLNTWAGQANALAAGLNAIATGSALAIPLTFSTTTTDSDPGNGIVRLNQATQNTATVIRTDLIGNDGSTWTDVIALFDDSTSTVKGFITLVDVADATKWLVFSVASLATPSGYVNITVACVASSTANPFTNGASLALKFTRNGDKGDQGLPGTVDATSLASTAHTATDKATPVDADELPLIDSAASWVLKKLTWANLKATLKTYFDTLYGAIASNNTWSKAQRGTYTTLTDAATIDIDLSANNFFKVLLGGNRTLGVPSGTVRGMTFQIDARQDQTGGRTLAYAWPFHFANGTAYQLSTGKCAFDILTGTVNEHDQQTVTMTIATPCVVTWPGVDLWSGQKVQFSTTGALPTGLSAATNYWLNRTGAGTYNLATSIANLQAGTYVATSGSQSGTHTMTATTITLTGIPGVA